MSRDIYYLCPDISFPSGGVKRLYRHVWILNQHGFSAAIVHFQEGFRVADIAYEVPVLSLHTVLFHDRSVLVIPDGVTALLEKLSRIQVPKIIIALNWAFIHGNLPQNKHWQHYGIEFVLTHSPDIADYIRWTMGIESYLFPISINAELFYEENKQPCISYLNRMNPEGDRIRKIFTANPELLHRSYTWIGMNNLDESTYAENLRKSMVFLMTGTHEGAPASAIEAMACGCLCIGYHGGGGRSFLDRRSDPTCMLVDPSDPLAFAKKLRHVLRNWDLDPNVARIRRNGSAFAAGFTPEKEISGLVSIWKEIQNRITPDR